MQTYREYLSSGGPSGLDGQENTCYDHDIDDMLVFMGRNRDSSILEESNWAAALAELGGESDTVQVHQFRHWACGWMELILIDPADAGSVATAERLQEAIENYPVLNEDDLNDREWEAFEAAWADYGQSEYIDAIALSLELPDDEKSHLAAAIRAEPRGLLQWHMDCQCCPYESDGGGACIPIPDTFTWGDVEDFAPSYVQGLKDMAHRLCAIGVWDRHGPEMRWFWDELVDFDPSPIFHLTNLQT